MTPYHLFRVAGTCFVYHLSAGRFIRISSEAYDLLELRLRMPKEDAEAMFMTAHPSAAGVVAEVMELEKEGFFEPTDEPILDNGEFETELAKRLSSPRNSVMLSVASGCNLACRYCYCGVCRDKIPNQGLMTEDTARRAVDALLAAADPGQGVRITFFGGEPLLNKGLIRSVVDRCDTLAAARGTSASYSITTNATLVDDEIAELIANRNFGLMVSLDGPQDLHDSQCPTRDAQGSYGLATAGIRRLMAHCGRVTVRCTMAHPAPNAMRLIRFFTDFGFARIVLGTVRNPTFPSDCDFTADDDREFDRCMEEEIIPWMLAEKAAGREPIYDPFGEIAEFQGEQEHPEKVPPFRCGACHGAMAVGPDGTLYPCHRFVGMDAWAIGQVESGPDRRRCMDFWRRYRACMKNPCARCWAYRVCGGPCPWEIARADSTFEMADSLCRETCKWIQHGVYYLSQLKSTSIETGGKK